MIASYGSNTAQVCWLGLRVSKLGAVLHIHEMNQTDSCSVYVMIQCHSPRVLLLSLVVVVSNLWHSIIEEPGVLTKKMFLLCRCPCMYSLYQA